ncbi:PstS family phosphate ABC transporter substrate-binding protein [Luteolibacter ambystomatis]|uniref:PstS family phosphate ABC transporter substrate-binding protein n=1 Tax=Luteolibacter ambystomatis TaxID=2824561 RepID=A0A975J2Q8_9BACT|nr:PstS family phosphate ABC transporter substrate-binding protein [Luteolibacter ambystomatis]QUE52909.1 PstS family phosphate ABC transporter substrate-binding protein [Luteolibacter ambystomatis]
MIRLKGSDTLGAKLIPQFAESYKADHPGVKFEIAAEGSTTAFTALLDGTADIGMSNRDIKPEEAKKLAEKGIEVESHIVAYDVLAIIVNSANPVTDLTRKQVEGLFAGDLANWKEAGGVDVAVRVFTRNTSSGTYKDFQVLAMNGRSYGSTAQRMAGSNPPQMEVMKEPGGIAYVGIAYSKASGVKVLRIEGKEPTAANLATYPYVRPCNLFIRKDAPAGVREFVQMAESAKGKEIARRVGFLTPP